MKKREIIILSAFTFTLGIILGFLVAPIKQGICNGNSSVGTVNYYDNERKKVEEE